MRFFSSSVGLWGTMGSNEADILSLLYWLRMLKEKRLVEGDVEGDSITVINWGLGFSLGSWHWHHYIMEVRVLVKELKVDLHHIPRVQNSSADKLTKRGAGKSETFIGDTMPDW